MRGFAGWAGAMASTGASVLGISNMNKVAHFMDGD